MICIFVIENILEKKFEYENVMVYDNKKIYKTAE